MWRNMRERGMRISDRDGMNRGGGRESEGEREGGTVG